MITPEDMRLFATVENIQLEDLQRFKRISKNLCEFLDQIDRELGLPLEGTNPHRTLEAIRKLKSK